MIAGYGARPVFQYKFRPLAVDREAPDGGFCVMLYENSVASFSMYGPVGEFLGERCFRLSARTISYYNCLIRNAGSWLGSVPESLRAPERSSYASSFAFDGYEPVNVYGINDLVTMPVGTAEGFYARHLYVLFEDVANLFMDSGVFLTMDSFNWDPEKASMFQRQQMNYSGVQRIV